MKQTETPPTRAEHTPDPAATTHHHQVGNQDHAHQHVHGGERSLLTTIAAALHVPGYGHSHERPGMQDAVFNNELGIRTVKLALLALGTTTLLQAIIYVASGSVALLADTVHNLGDALNSIPLWIAFVLARRAATKRYTYGYGRAEDIAGLVIVLSIVFSAGYILWESIEKLIHPRPLENLAWVAAAALVGFVGNELVAVMQIRVGRQIGSEAMVTDGRHARIDGYTSLSVLAAAAGAWLGFPLADPLIGLLIGVAIVFITKDAVAAMWYRLMDAVDPQLVEKAEAAIRTHDEVKEVSHLRMRWLGHALHLEAGIVVEGTLTTAYVSEMTDQIMHLLYHAIPNLTEVSIAALSSESNAGTHSAHHRH